MLLARAWASEDYLDDYTGGYYAGRAKGRGGNQSRNAGGVSRSRKASKAARGKAAGRALGRRPRTMESTVVAFFLTALLCVGMLLGYLSLRMEIVKTGYELMKAKARLADVVGEHDRLKLRLARSGSLNRIEKIAREKLGMREPGSVEYGVVATSKGKLAATDLGGREWELGSGGETGSGWFAGDKGRKTVTRYASQEDSPPARFLVRGFVGRKGLENGMAAAILGLASEFVVKWFFEIPYSQALYPPPLARP